MTPAALARCAVALPHWARIAVWGILSPRVERHPLEIVQGVIAGERGVLLGVRWELRGWELPGGSPEPGEDDATALRREIREEVGLEVQVGDRIGSYVRTGFRPHTARVYRCEIVPGTPTPPSYELTRVRWFDAAAPPPTLFGWCRQPLRDFVSGGPPAERREHQGMAEILDAMRIDLRMRAAGDRAA